mmetsp:Transcript_23740/g.76273  ORF Transcript_23740/g.76273 Transcript_23740/m.76273 type:complete len:250 (-) Transcript_23740:188-937(-)
MSLCVCGKEVERIAGRQAGRREEAGKSVRPRRQRETVECAILLFFPYVATMLYYYGTPPVPSSSLFGGGDSIDFVEALVHGVDFVVFFRRLLLLVYGGDKGGLVGDAAGVVAELEVDVAVESPVVGPRVLDDEVFGGAGEVEADELDGVVELEGAVGAGVHCQDAPGVGGPLGGVDGDGEGSEGDEVLREGVFVLGEAPEGFAGDRRPLVGEDLGAVDDVLFLGVVALRGVAVVREGIVRVVLFGGEAV